MRALYLTQSETKKPHIAIQDVPSEQLNEQEGDTLVDVLFSTINYKDALALTGRSPVVRMWPMVPGIDFVGKIKTTESNRFQKGDLVILNGWGCGETHWGGLAQSSKVKSEWLVKLPSTIAPSHSMALGTAGYTAALCVQRLLELGIKTTDGEILVTGATGGVGSVAIALLNQLGYQVVAMTSKITESSQIEALGAKRVINSEDYLERGKPLKKSLWAGAIDVVGSTVLANICTEMNYSGKVVACGLAKGMDLPLTVAPFILRNVSLSGVDSVMAPLAIRESAWAFLAKYLPVTFYDRVKAIPLSEVTDYAEKMMKNQITHRVIVDVNQ